MSGKANLYRTMEKMKRFCELHKKELGLLAGAFLFSLLPVLCGAVRCAADGRSLFQVYLPASFWNDEMFYYKLTENVVEFGYPRGYFGFNESHARCLSFAAWSPVLLLFWVIWGVLFGWNLLSPVFCNIAVLGLALFVFVLLTKPNIRQLLSLAVLYAAFTPVTRFSLSCIPETSLFALLILFIGVAVNCERAYRGYKIAVLFALMLLLTCMRPYLLLLFLTPAVLWVREKGKKTVFFSLFLVLATVGVYYAVNHFFSAPYLTDLFYTEWIEVYFQEGFVQGLGYTLHKLWESSIYIAKMMWQCLMVEGGMGSAAGLYYFVFLALAFFFFVKLLLRWKKRKWQGALLEVQMLFCMAGFFVADLLMYRLQEGGRHTLVYIIGSIFILSVDRPRAGDEGKNADLKQNIRRMILPGGILILFLAVFIGRGKVPYEFSIPYDNEAHRSELESLEKELAANMELTDEVPGYENTIVWTLWDYVGEETEVIDFGLYYGMPKGFGINACDGGYITANLENMKCRYIGAYPGGEFEKRCLAAGGKPVGGCSDLIIYDMKK